MNQRLFEEKYTRSVLHLETLIYTHIIVHNTFIVKDEIYQKGKTNVIVILIYPIGSSVPVRFTIVATPVKIFKNDLTGRKCPSAPVD